MVQLEYSILLTFGQNEYPLFGGAHERVISVFHCRAGCDGRIAAIISHVCLLDHVRDQLSQLFGSQRLYRCSQHDCPRTELWGRRHWLYCLSIPHHLHALYYSSRNLGGPLPEEGRGSRLRGRLERDYRPDGPGDQLCHTLSLAYAAGCWRGRVFSRRHSPDERLFSSFQPLARHELVERGPVD